MYKFERTKFFLVAPELARLAKEAKIIAGISPIKGKHHHELTEAIAEFQEQNVIDLTQSIEHFTNPFADECDQVINLVTKAVMSEKYNKLSTDALRLEMSNS